MSINSTSLNNDAAVFFIDLDGTLLDESAHDGRRRISKKNLQAIAKAQKDGKRVIISTGRMGVNVKEHLKALQARYAILANGAQIIAEGKMVRDLKISVRQILLIHLFAQKHQLVMKLDDENEVWGARSSLSRYISRRLGYVASSGFYFDKQREYTKVVLWGKKANKIKSLAAELEDFVDGVRTTTSTKGYTIEITHREASKGLASRFLNENYFHLEKEKLVHIGDSMNDVTVIGHVGRLIIMSNAERSVKAIARYLGPNYKHGGVAKVLEGHYKIKEKFSVGKADGFSILF